MRLTRILIVLGVMFCLASYSYAAEGNAFTISLRGSLTTGSQLYTNPDSPDEVQRTIYSTLKDTWGYGMEIRYRLPETDLAVALSAEYLKAADNSTQSITGSSLPIPVYDGYTVFPVEITGYFIIPFSGEVFGVYMGGGGGAYFGRRTYRMANVEASSIDHTVGFGIHVLTGVSYHFNRVLSLSAEMKFRDLQFRSTNAFTQSSVRYSGVPIPLDTSPFSSQVHTDGIIFQFGAAVEF